jgi:type I restriction enzyme S subunit
MTMESEWRTAKLGELVAFKTGKLDSNAAVPNGDYPFFTCSQETLRTNSYSFDTECVLLAGNNANGIFPLKYFHGKFDAYQRTYVVTPRDPNLLMTRFLYYVLRPKLSEFRSFSTGAATKFLTLTILNKTEIEVPLLPVQERIAGTLAAYDELMENSQRRIRILEAMARALYREWFIYFRFPGHETVPRLASPLGDIPQGWEVKKLGEVAQTFRGRSYGSVDLADEGGLPFLNLKCLDRDGGFRRSGLKRYTGEYKDNHVAKKGDIVVAVTDMTQERRIVARAALVPTLDREFGIFSMDLVRVEPKPPMPKTFIYSLLRYSSFADEVKQHANGANVLHLAPERITDFRLAIPPADLIRRFANFVAPTLEHMDTLQNQIENLRRTRDLLLPKLLSGEIDVSRTPERETVAV